MELKELTDKTLQLLHVTDVADLGKALMEHLDDKDKRRRSKTDLVKHAHWIDMRLDDVHVCSHCDKVVVFMNGNEPNYCPYCGARMDEKGNE